MTSGDTPDVKLVPEDTPTCALPLLPELRSEEKRERVNTIVVTVLSVACTVLALFDLFLLAWGL